MLRTHLFLCIKKRCSKFIQVKWNNLDVYEESSTSYPGGNQVDGLPPAPSFKASKEISRVTWRTGASTAFGEVTRRAPQEVSSRAKRVTRRTEASSAFEEVTRRTEASSAFEEVLRMLPAFRCSGSKHGAYARFVQSTTETVGILRLGGSAPIRSSKHRAYARFVQSTTETVGIALRAELMLDLCRALQKQWLFPGQASRIYSQ